MSTELKNKINDQQVSFNIHLDNLKIEKALKNDKISQLEKEIIEIKKEKMIEKHNLEKQMESNTIKYNFKICELEEKLKNIPEIDEKVKTVIENFNKQIETIKEEHTNKIKRNKELLIFKTAELLEKENIIKNLTNELKITKDELVKKMTQLVNDHKIVVDSMTLENKKCLEKLIYYEKEVLTLKLSFKSKTDEQMKEKENIIFKLQDELKNISNDLEKFKKDSYNAQTSDKNGFVIALNSLQKEKDDIITKQKQELRQIRTDFDKNKTEYENMLEKHKKEACSILNKVTIDSKTEKDVITEKLNNEIKMLKIEINKLNDSHEADLIEKKKDIGTGFHKTVQELNSDKMKLTKELADTKEALRKLQVFSETTHNNLKVKFAADVQSLVQKNKDLEKTCVEKVKAVQTDDENNAKLKKMRSEMLEALRAQKAENMTLLGKYTKLEEESKKKDISVDDMKKEVERITAEVERKDKRINDLENLMVQSVVNSKKE